MLDMIKNFFDWIVDIVTSLWSFLESFFRGLTDLFRIVPQAISYLTSSLGYLPSTLIVFATLTISISVIYLIVGRNTGG